jgi:hypothetical protein
MASIRKTIKAAKQRDKESRKRWGTGLPKGIEDAQALRRYARRDKVMRKADREGADYSIFNPARKSVILKNFTGTVTKNPDGTVSIRGRKK